MPEYHNLQAYARYDEPTFRTLLSRYRDVLRTVGGLDAAVEAWLAGFEWDAGEDDLVRTGPAAPWVEIESAGVALRAAPDVVAYTADAYPRAGDRWAQLGLLFETDALQHGSSFSAWEYREGLGPAVWGLMRAFGPAFPEVGVFFTDEAQDGRALEGFLGERDRLWEFDMAWVPEANAPLLTPVADTYFSARVDGALVLAPRGAWKSPPWE